MQRVLGLDFDVLSGGHRKRISSCYMPCAVAAAAAAAVAVPAAVAVMVAGRAMHARYVSSLPARPLARCFSR